MSQPQSSKDLSFVRHSTRQFTYVPGHDNGRYVFAYVAICLGAAIICSVLALIVIGA